MLRKVCGTMGVATFSKGGETQCRIYLKGYVGLSLGPQDPRGASNKLWYA